MAAFFLDSSAVVKRYAAETGSSWITSLTDIAAGNACWIASVTRVEILAALYLKVRTGEVTVAQAQQAEQAFRSELGSQFRLIAATPAILDHAMDLVAKHPLRAYDAVQLASALHLRSQCVALAMPAPTFVSADQELNRAAAAEGLAIDDPNPHR
jgi:hypothetical protein